MHIPVNMKTDVLVPENLNYIKLLRQRGGNDPPSAVHPGH